MCDLNGGREMKSASIFFGLAVSFLMNSQEVFAQPANGVFLPFAIDCRYEIPPCEPPPPSGPRSPIPIPPPAPGGGGIHNLPGAPVLKETIIIPGNNMLKDFKLDEPKMLDMQKELQNRWSK